MASERVEAKREEDDDDWGDGAAGGGDAIDEDDDAAWGDAGEDGSYPKTQRGSDMQAAACDAAGGS